MLTENCARFYQWWVIWCSSHCRSCRVKRKWIRNSWSWNRWSCQNAVSFISSISTICKTITPPSWVDAFTVFASEFIRFTLNRNRCSLSRCCYFCCCGEWIWCCWRGYCWCFWTTVIFIWIITTVWDTIAKPTWINAFTIFTLKFITLTNFDIWNKWFHIDEMDQGLNVGLKLTWCSCRSGNFKNR